MIEILFALALAIAVPIGALLTAGLVSAPARTGRLAVVVGGAISGAVGALAIGRGPVPAAIAIPWWVVAVGLAGATVARIVRDAASQRALEPWRLGLAAASAFLAVGATWLVVDRAGLRPLGFGTTIVMLTAVHFHVAGFVLTLAGALAVREQPGPASIVPVGLVVAGTPLTALGFLGLPIVGWIGAMLVTLGALGTGLATIAVRRAAGDGPARALLTIGGATLFVTMPLAAIYATGTTFGIAVLDIPAMAAIHGGLNVVGFAIPTMAGWRRSAR